ncbi:MAG: lamin tail domain-containing protein, partial [Verrucomicrobiota bacterium]
YPLFGPDATDEFDTLIFRMESNDGWQWTTSGNRLYARDQLGRDMQNALGQPASHGTNMHLYLNGVYWGMYNIVERPDNDFGSTYVGGADDEWDGINSGNPPGNGNVVNASGDPTKQARAITAWNTLMSLTANVNGGATEDDRTDAYLTLQGLNPDGSDNPGLESFLDVDNMIDYLIVNYYMGNNDWPRKNYYVGRWNHPDSPGWQFFMWDAEWSIDLNSSVTIDRVNDARGVAAPFQNLRASAEFRLRFADRIHRAFFNGGPMYVDPMNPGWDPGNPDRNRPAAQFTRITDRIASPLIAESARWGDQHQNPPNTVQDDWVPKVNDVLANYFPQRTANVLEDFRGHLLYPNLDAPAFNQHGGTFDPGFNLTITAPAGTIYYTLDGTDPREFRSGLAVGMVYSGPIVLNDSAVVKARVFDGLAWSALNEALFVRNGTEPIEITEVMYHAPSPQGSETNVSVISADFDYIEIRNAGAAPVSLAGLVFSRGIEFDFAEGNVNSLAPGEFAVVVGDYYAFTTRYANAAGLNIAGEYRGELDNGGESVTLSKIGVGDLLTVEFNDARGWPVSPDGAGHSLVPLVGLSGQLNEELDYGRNWRASTYLHGSPGEADPAPVTSILLNEFAAHTDNADTNTYPNHDSDDWIEIYNAGGAANPLNDWYLSDSADDLKKWAIPPALLLADDWRSFRETTDFHNPLTNGFGLNKAGEQLFLSHLPGTAIDRVADSVRFKGQENGRTLGRYGDGQAWWHTLTPTFNMANPMPLEEPVINEVMYHPAPTALHPSNNTAHEYIVILNPTPAPVALTNETGSWRIEGEVDFDFPGDTVLAPYEPIVLLSFNPTNPARLNDFQTHYGLTPGQVRFFGPYDGKLSNHGGRISLERPQAPDLINEGISCVNVDEVSYYHLNPWTTEA